jgi:hypothetical protein
MRIPLVVAFVELFEMRKIVSFKTTLFEEYVVPEIVKSPPTFKDPPRVRLEFPELYVRPEDPDTVLAAE